MAAKVEPFALPAVCSTLIIEFIKRRNIQKALELFGRNFARHRYSLGEYFNILHELAINDYETEFNQVRYFEIDLAMYINFKILQFLILVMFFILVTVRI